MLRRQRPVPSLPFLLLGVFLVLVGGIALYFLATREEPQQGGSYTEGIAGSPMHLNPLLASFNETDEDLTSLLFSGVTRIDQKGMVVPDLAEAWEVSADGKTYTFRLSENSAWHDGRPILPEDILFTIRLVQNSEFQANPELSALWRKVKAEKVDERTVRLVLEQPFAPLLAYTSLGILPQHRFEGVSLKDFSNSALNQNPIGSGPFRIKEASLERVILEANPNSYFKRPYLDRLQFNFMKDDKTLAAALRTNQVEGGLLRPSLGRETIDQVQENAELRSYSAPRASYTILFLNSQSPLFSQKAIRQALAYSIDRQKLVQDITGGRGITARGPIPLTSWAHTDGSSWYSYDPAKAAQLLDQEGWKLNGTGVREKEGRTLKFTLYTNDDALRIAAGEELARQFKRVGLQPEFASSGPTGLIQNFLLPRKFDAIIYGIDPGADPDPYPLWHSSQATGEGLNVATVALPELDKLLEQARTTTQQTVRRQLYHQFQTLFREEVPSIPLYHPLYTYAVNRQIRGVVLDGLIAPSSRFFNIKDWYKETQRVWSR